MTLEQVSKQEEVSYKQNVITGVTAHHLCHILLVRSNHSSCLQRSLEKGMGTVRVPLPYDVLAAVRSRVLTQLRW